MNRSVINCMIAAGVLFMGSGVVAAPAVADTVESGPASDADNDARAKNLRSGQSHRGERPGIGLRHAREWQCQLSRPCPSETRTRLRGNSIMGLPIFAAVPAGVPPVLAVAPTAEPELDLSALSAPSALAAPEEPGQAIAPAPPAEATVVAVQPARRPVADPPARTPAVPLSAAPGAPRVIPAPPPQTPGPFSELGPSLRLGYPDELRNADFGTVASLALPGLAAIVGMTALGGLLGYRQAKAGYVLRAAGAGRFLQ